MKIFYNWEDIEGRVNDLCQKLKHEFCDRYDHYPVRCKFINCEYTNEEFDVTKLKPFNSVHDGYGQRTHTPDHIIDRS